MPRSTATFRNDDLVLADGIAREAVDCSTSALRAPAGERSSTRRGGGLAAYRRNVCAPGSASPFRMFPGIDGVALWDGPVVRKPPTVRMVSTRANGRRDSGARRWVPCATALVLVLAACRGPAQYVNPNVDLSEMKTVAVLPFVNVSNDKVASEKVLRILVTELLATGEFDVVEPGAVVRALMNDKLDPAVLTSEDFVSLG